MGSYLSEPVTDKETDVYVDSHFRVGSSCMQGWRQKQEDAHNVILGFGQHKLERDSNAGVSAPELPPEAGLFAVFDGHGGPEVSAYASTRVEAAYASALVNEGSGDEVFQNIIMDLDMDIRQHFTRQMEEAQSANTGDDDQHNMHDELNRKLLAAKESGMNREAAINLLNSFVEMQRKSKPHSNTSDSQGCTCVTALIVPREVDGETIYRVKATNSGDSRVLVWNQETDMVYGTKDHKPNDPEENARIINAGGHVKEQITATRTQYRVNGNLNLCRALGDFEYKKRDDLPAQQQMITSCPDVYSWDCRKGDIVVLACDGIFDVLTNEEVIQFVRERINAMDLGTLCEDAMMRCLAPDPKESSGLGADNMTIMVVHLTGESSGFPPNVLPEREEEVGGIEQ